MIMVLHSPYLHRLALCDFFLLLKLTLALKGGYYGILVIKNRAAHNTGKALP